MAIAVDASTPAIFHAPNGNDGTPPAFTPPANSLLVAFVTTMTASGTTVTTSDGLSWSKAVESSSLSAQIWTAWQTTSASRTVRPDDQQGGAGNSLVCKTIVLTGVNPNTPIAQTTQGTATTDPQTISAYTSTIDGSFGLFVLMDSTNNGTATSTDTEFVFDATDHEHITIHKSAVTATAGTPVTFQVDPAVAISGVAAWVAIEIGPPTAPLAPTITFQAGGHERAGVQWTPGSDGGAAVTDWDIDHSRAGVDPDDIANLAAWLDATHSASITGTNPVTAWADRSAAAIGTFTATSDPNTTATTLNGLAVMDLDGGDYFINSTPFLYALGDFTAFAVARINNTTGVACALGEANQGDTNPTMRLGSLNGDAWFEHSNGAGGTEYSITSIAVDDGLPHLFRFVDSTTVASLTVDGGTTVDSAAYVRSATTMTRSGIGNCPRSSPDGVMSGYIAEIVVYNRVLTASEIADVEAYLNNRWRTPTWLGPTATGTTNLYGAVTGLTNSTAYKFRARGVNTVGDGIWSATSGSATPTDVRGFFLLEDGTSKFLLEDGTSRFLLEAGSGDGSITGTVAVTLGVFAPSAAGTYTPPAITGTVAVTLGSFTPSTSGTYTPPPVTGTVAVTLAAFTSTASGTYTPPAITGTTAVTLAVFAAAATGTVSGAGEISGTVSVILASFVSAGSGTATPPGFTGTVAVTLAAFTSTAAGTSIAAVTGTTAVILDPFTPAAVGTANLPAITGTVAVTLAAFICSAFEIGAPVRVGALTTAAVRHKRSTVLTAHARTTTTVRHKRTTEAP